MNKIEVIFYLFLLYFIRYSVFFGSIKILRGLLGSTGVIVLSFTCSFYFMDFNLKQTEINEFYNNFSVNFILQIVLGAIFGIIASLIFEVIPFTGRLIDIFRGNQFAEQFAPELGARESQLEMYGGFFVVCLFFQEEYFFKVLDIIYKYHIVNVNPFNVLSKFTNLEFIFKVSKDFFELSILLVLPLILISFSLEIALSVLQKLNSKFQTGVELSLLKSGLGVLFLFFILVQNEEISFKINDFYNRFFEAIG